MPLDGNPPDIDPGIELEYEAAPGLPTMIGLGIVCERATRDDPLDGSGAMPDPILGTPQTYAEAISDRKVIDLFECHVELVRVVELNAVQTSYFVLAMSTTTC